MEERMEGIEILVEGEGLRDLETVHVPHGGTLREVVTIVASRGGFSVEEALIFIEDRDEPLDLTIVIDEEAHGRIHHVHRARQVEVAVSYQAGTHEKKFSPSATIQRVLDWAVGRHGFNIDPTIAPEMELALHGRSQALPKTAHIGRYVRHERHHLHLDMIRGVVPNGAAP
jgi:hypothetical protein